VVQQVWNEVIEPVYRQRLAREQRLEIGEAVDVDDDVEALVQRAEPSASARTNPGALRRDVSPKPAGRRRTTEPRPVAKIVQAVPSLSIGGRTIVTQLTNYDGTETGAAIAPVSYRLSGELGRR